MSMRFFCREDHSEQVQQNLGQELLEAKADVARLKKMPVSAFVEKSSKALRYTPFGPMSYSVDNKDDAIARAKAKVAELEVLTPKEELK
jgi:hypothetical protein